MPGDPGDWTRGDANAVGETFTPDVDYVPYDGTRSIGRQVVAKTTIACSAEC
ncbi:MAG: hypothetical protein M3O70_04420 [Actinomycetota bacterium]|nr:hypothetical protein [Actinomycetota bacterium]